MAPRPLPTLALNASSSRPLLFSNVALPICTSDMRYQFRSAVISTRSQPTFHSASGGAVEMVAGALANWACTLVTYPIETVRANIATCKKASVASVFKQKGVRGLYWGVNEALFLSLPMGAIYLGVLHTARQMLGSRSQNGNKNQKKKKTILAPIPSLVAALTAQFSTGLFSVPSEAMRLHTQLGLSPSLFSAAKSILSGPGPLALHRGYGFAMARSVPLCLLRFGAVDHLEALYSQFKKSPITAAEQSAVGTLLGVTAAVLSYPLDSIFMSMVSGSTLDLRPW
eukprot:CAMPEP_0184650006 /NCGR_PEP_ID=MMETSP0308-20130426/7483_1 /TAXON_ID=38269 /ORGANISM="Gloeochaete witrockiana, Strain SAG 46.84" /LENGTH=283 /DNA_ID=CAMNT_0027083207 /DNA_START=246 /DNA_END=1094 /DNA_ORIENTATION=+